MNWIGGIFNVDDQPVEPSTLERLIAPVRSAAVDGCVTHIDGPVGLVCCGVSTTDSRVGLVVHDGGRLAVAFDGRLDNRADLMRALSIRDEAGASGPSDAELVLRSYRRGESEWVSTLIGDFTFALWDRHARTLLCATDVFGVRRVFHCITGNSFAWASTIRQLLSLNVPRTIDEEYLANYLVRLELPLEVTPYKAIRRLAQAHLLAVRPGGVTIRRYWQPDPTKQTRYRQDSDYEERFRELLTRAVSARLRSHTPVWYELSGGLDSSSIVCVADQLRRASGWPRVETISWVYDAAYYSDERRWILPVVDKCDAQAHVISCDEYYPLQDFEQSAFQWDEPAYVTIFCSLVARIGELLRQHGVRVVLSGVAGDQTIVPGYTPVYISDLVKQGHFRDAARELREWQRPSGFPWATVFMASCVRPLLHPNLVRFQYAETEYVKNPVPSWVNKRFARRMGLRERALCRLVAPKYRSRAFQSQVERIMETPLWRGPLENICEHRYPYLDRPLVEFALSVPWKQLFRPGEHKALLRRALTGILPPEIRNRRSNRGPEHAFYLGLNREWPRLQPRFRELRLADLDIVDGKEFNQALALARAGFSKIGLFETLSLEQWCGGLEPTPHLATEGHERASLTLSHVSRSSRA
jgi:asparagine synthase (glutamine-hydrolysing)